MKKKLLVLGALIALFRVIPAHAEAGITTSLGTTGLGVHLSIPVTERLNARFGINGLGSYSRNGGIENINYDAKLKIMTVDALVDYFPSGEGFRITGGMVYNGSKIDAKGRPSGSGIYIVNGRIYFASAFGTLDGEVNFRKVVPYVGIGWGNAIAKVKGWGLSSDVGILFHGAPTTSLTNQGCTASTDICTQIAADVAAERRTLQNDLNKFKVFPVLRVGARYAF